MKHFNVRAVSYRMKVFGPQSPRSGEADQKHKGKKKPDMSLTAPLDADLLRMMREIQAYLACSASTPADIVMTCQVFGTKRPLRLPPRKSQAQQEYVGS